MKDATRPVGARVAQAQIYASLGSMLKSSRARGKCVVLQIRAVLPIFANLSDVIKFVRFQKPNPRLTGALVLNRTTENFQEMSVSVTYKSKLNLTGMDRCFLQTNFDGLHMTSL